MNRFIAATVLLVSATLAATPALAGDAPSEGSKSSSVELTATTPKSCAFTTTPPSTVALATNTTAEFRVGDLGFTCNFTGQVSFVINLPNGTNLRNDENGGDTVRYGLAWTLPPNSSTPSYQYIAGNLGFDWPTTQAPNVEQKGTLWIKPERDLRVAGTYRSVIGYTITP